jgi:hypothetical protein
MNLNHLLFFAGPAALAIFKLSALVLAAVWALGASFAPQGLLSGAQSHPRLVPAPAPRARGKGRHW